MISNIFNTILLNPLVNVLVFLYAYIPGHDFGIAIVILTICIRVIFIPLSIKTIVSQQSLAKVQPKLKELQEKHKDNREALGTATMSLYREHNVNPLSGCLPLLIQFPVLIALYKSLTVVFGSIEHITPLLYSFVPHPAVINPLTLGLVDLTKPAIILAIIAAALQFIQARNSLTMQQKAGTADKNSPAQRMSSQMMYFLPFMILLISWRLPAGITLYWVVTTLFSIFEQHFIYRRYATAPATKLP